MLERVSLPAEAAGKLLDDVVAAPAVDEAMLLSTCNRVELYASVEKFHAGVAALSELLARHTGVGFDELSPHVYVHYEERAAQHLFAVTSSLDSMLVGEHQILGSGQNGFRNAQDRGDAGSVLHEVVEHALHAAKRAHAETGIDAAGSTLVEAGLQLGVEALRIEGGSHIEADAGLRARRAIVVGAGSMASVAAAALRGFEVGDLLIVSRTLRTAQSLAARVDGRAVADGRSRTRTRRRRRGCHLHWRRQPWCSRSTWSNGRWLRAPSGRSSSSTSPFRVMSTRGSASCLASRLSTSTCSLRVVQHAAASDDVREARRIVDAELAAYAAARRASGVAPTVVALRDKAAQMVATELHRLDRRLPDLDDAGAP